MLFKFLLLSWQERCEMNKRCRIESCNRCMDSQEIGKVAERFLKTLSFMGCNYDFIKRCDFEITKQIANIKTSQKSYWPCKKLEDMRCTILCNGLDPNSQEDIIQQIHHLC